MNSKKETTTVQPIKPSDLVKFTGEFALRLARLLDEFVGELATLEREDDRQFIITCTQIFSLYGMAQLAEGYMVNASPYFEQIAKCRGKLIDA